MIAVLYAGILFSFLGTIYAIIAIARHFYLRAEFNRLSIAQKTDLANELNWRSRIAASKTSFTMTVLWLIAGIAFLIGLATSAAALIIISMLGLILATPLLIGFNAPSVWSRKTVYSEGIAIDNNFTTIQAYYLVLYTTWAGGLIGNIILNIQALGFIGSEYF